MDNREAIYSFNDETIPLIERLRHPGWTREEYRLLCMVAARVLEQNEKTGGCVNCPKLGDCNGYVVQHIKGSE
jgi:hypothetical protein